MRTPDIKIEHVMQQCGKSCVIACLSMVTGKHFNTVKDEVLDQGMPVYTITPKMIPIIQVREDFKWLTDEARSRINAKLVELVGCREECAVPKDKILMASGSILARPETVSLLANIVA